MSTRSEQSSHHRVSTFLLAILFILAAMLLMGQSAVTPGDEAVEGKEVFERVCTTCHTTQPPPNLAPPMAMILRHYGMALGDSAAVRDTLVSWIGSPDASRSMLPAHAVERFGVMAPVDLTPEEIDAVTDYIMTLDADMPRRGMMMQGRMGAGMKQCGMKKQGAGNGMKQCGMMKAAVECPRVDSTATPADCPRMDAASGRTCRMGN